MNIDQTVTISMLLLTLAARPADDPLARYRTALRWDPVRGAATVRLESRARAHDTPGADTLVAAPDGRLLRRTTTSLSLVEWFDGTAGLVTDWSGMPRPLRGGDLESAKLIAAIQAGTWLAPGAAVGLDLARDPSGRTLAVRGGLLSARLTLDAEGRPSRADFETLSGPQRLELSWGNADAPWIPTRLRHTLHGLPLLEFDLVEGYHAASAETGMVAPVLEAPADFSIDGDQGPIPLERAATGHVMVETDVNGVRGWFILDTGASVTVVQAGAATAGARRLATSPLVSVYGVTSQPILRIDSLRVGPVVLRGLPVIEADLGFLSDALGRPVAGIIGYDLLARVVADIDLTTPSLVLGPTPGPQADALPWEPLVLESKLPIVTGRWDGGEGIFRLDVGAGPPVIFNGPTVVLHRLLESQGTGERVPAGTETLVVGKVAWFEVGGLRVPDVVTLLAENPMTGPFSDPHLAGNLGLGILERFRIVLDFPRARIALIPHRPAGSP